MEFMNCDVGEVWTNIVLRFGDVTNWTNVSACVVGGKVVVYIR